jgi:S-sulfo-L-cysteine synthase (O-acetyl-L-serine-dependent)
MIIERMTDLIGNTPLLKLDPKITGLKNIDLYAKLEMMNPFGSLKDRTAWGMIKDDIDHIAANNMTIYENSSGNTAKSLQAIAGIFGAKFHLVSALNKVEEQKNVLQILGSEMDEIIGASDCFDPSDNNDPQYLIQRTVRENPHKVYFPSQFTNKRNPDYHRDTTGEEIARDVGFVDYFFNGLGTTGSSLGITQRLKQDNENLISIGIVPAANHFIPGIRNMSQMWESELFDSKAYSQFITITEQEAIDGMLELNRRYGVLCGVSAGAHYKATRDYLQKIDTDLTERKTAVFIVCDRMEWYISYLKERRPELFGEKENANGLSSYRDAVSYLDLEIAAENFHDFQSQHSPIIIDLRAPQALDIIRIPHSLNIPVDSFARWVNGTNPFNTDAKVILVCAVGEKSGYYARYLRSLGAQAYNLAGGIMAWRDAQHTSEPDQHAPMTQKNQIG